MNVPGNDPPHVDVGGIPGGIIVSPPVVVAPPVVVVSPPVVVVPPAVPVVELPPVEPVVVGSAPGPRPELVGSTSPHPWITVGSAIPTILAANVNRAVRCRAATMSSLLRRGSCLWARPSVEGTDVCQRQDSIVAPPMSRPAGDDHRKPIHHRVSTRLGVYSFARSMRPSGCLAKRPSSRGCTGPS